MERTAVSGEPRSGKSTLLRALGRTSPGAKHSHIVYSLPDETLVRIAQAEGSAQVTPVKLSFEEVGGRSVAPIRESDCVVVVVRPEASQDATQASKEGIGQVYRWVDTAILEDLSVIEGAIPRLKKIAAAGDRHVSVVVEASQKLVSLLESQDIEAARNLARDTSLIPKEWGLVISKPLIVIVNIDESLATNTEKLQRLVADKLAKVATAVIASPLEIEAGLAEIAEADADTAAEMAAEFSIETPIATRLASAVLRALGLIVFYTANDKEARAWLLPEGSTALEAAGRIHSDMERGFIRAEVIPAKKLLEVGSLKEARRRGAVRLEGKSYVVRPEDVLFVRFNV